jgi:hypothetical protein
MGRISALFIAVTAGLGLVSGTAAATDESVVPPGFVPSSTSWTSAGEGWVLGFAPCTTGSARQCAGLIRTFDGGRHWVRTAAPPVRVAPDNDQVRVHFANELDGLITNGHQVFTTHTAGAVWRPVALPSPNIWTVASNDKFMYAIVIDDSSTRLVSSPVHRDQWAPVPGVSLPNGRGGGDIAARGDTVFVALNSIFEATAYWSSSDGRTFRPGTPPCAVDAQPRLGLAKDGALFALCSSNPGRGMMFKDLQRAQPDGTFAFVSSGPDLGITEGFDAASSSTVAAAAVGAGAAFVHRATAGGTTWDTPFVGEESQPFDLHFTDARHGTFVLGGPGWPVATVYRTTDSAATWTPLSLR